MMNEPLNVNRPFYFTDVVSVCTGITGGKVKEYRQLSYECRLCIQCDICQIHCIPLQEYVKRIHYILLL